MSDPVNIDIVKVEGTAVLSTGESGGSKFLREDGDGTCSWQSIPGGGDALTSNPLSQFAATTSTQLAGVISDETGSGALVFANTPTLVTPVLGTPTSGTLTNCTGLPVSTGVSGLGTGVATALAVNVGLAGAPVVLNGAGGTPSAITLTNGTGLPVSGITASTSTAIGVGSIELGHASDTTIARSGAGVVTIEGVEVTTNSATQTLTNKTLTSPVINTPALGANSVDAITEIAAALKSGSDGTLVTGTAGTSGDLATWNADGDLVDGPTPPSGTIVGTSDTQTLTNKTLTSPVLNTGVSGTAVLDEDNMASDSATQLATQQSIKAYVDAESADGRLDVIQVPLTGPGGTLTASDKFYFDFPFAGTVTKFEVKAQTAPTTSAATFDLSRNASWGSAPSTMLTGDLSLSASSFEASTTSFASASVTAGDVGEIEITAADSGATCADAIALIHITRS